MIFSVIMTLSFIAVLSSGIVLCDSNSSQIGQPLPGYANYRVVTTKYVSWNTARRWCQKSGGDLAAFETRTEWTGVGAALAKHYHGRKFFIGGRGNGKGQYEWVTGDGSVIDNRNPAWYEDLNCTGCEHVEPNYGGGTGICVFAKASTDVNSSWSDDRCFWKQNFICEF